MIDKMLNSLLTELKTKVKVSSGKIREDELIDMINLIARTEMELKLNYNGSHEEFEKEILKFVSYPRKTKIKKIL